MGRVIVATMLAAGWVWLFSPVGLAQEKVKEGAKAAGGAAKTAGGAVADTAKEGAKVAGKAGRAVGETASEAGKATGEAATEVGKSVGAASGNAAKKIGRRTRSAARRAKARASGGQVSALCGDGTTRKGKTGEAACAGHQGVKGQPTR
jgi:hypothetical protein